MFGMFISDYNEISGRSLIIDDDKFACWAYMTMPFSNEIYMDCWLYNKQKALPMSEISIYRNMPPPASAEVLVPGYSHMNDISEERISFRWDNDGETAYIYLDNEILAAMFAEERKAYNINLCKDCAWGKRFLIPEQDKQL
ncbi:MAG: hypothetical protein ACI4XF_12280 [Oscillospiraceae bacterium]